MAPTSTAAKRGAGAKLAPSNIATKLAEKEAQDASPPWSRVLPLALIACVCAVLASPGSAIGPDGPAPRFAAVTARLAARDAGGAGETEARSAVAPAVAALQGRVLLLGAGAYTSLLTLPGLGSNAVPVDERPLLMPALASAASAAGAAAPLNLSTSNLSSVPDASVDAVLSLGALCRANLTAALPELRRVLKAGSPLIVFEPTLSLASTTTRRLQALASPLHEILTDGCRLDDDIAGSLDAAGWTRRSVVRLQAAEARLWLVGSYVLGVFE